MDVVVPELGDGEEADLAEWLVPDGSQVEAGVPIATLETNKVLVEVEAPTQGKLQILVEAGAVVETGAAIGRIL